MAELALTGLTASLKLGGNVIGYISGVTLSLEKEIIEILSFGDTYKQKVPAVKDWSASFDGTASFATDGQQILLYEAFESGDPITVGIYLSNTKYFSGTGYMSSLEIEAAPDDKINISGEIAGSNGVTFSINSTNYSFTSITPAQGTAVGTSKFTVVGGPAGGDNLMIKVGKDSMPAVGAVLTDNTDGWTDYTSAADYVVSHGSTVWIAEVITASGVVVKRGSAVANTKLS